MPKETVLKDNGKEFLLQDSSISEIWGSNWMNNFRQRFINEEKRPECEECWKEEDAGVFSFRQQQSHIPVNVKKPVITELVLKLSNKCNCACRICTWYLSSLWESEFKKTSRMPNEHMTWFVDGNSANKVTTHNWEDWKTHLGTVRHLSLYGGEPLINDEALKLLDYLINENLSQNIDIGLNTNGTIINDRVISMLGKFQKVNLHFSIDDIGDRFEYQRWPAKSSSVFKSLKDLHDGQYAWNNSKGSQFQIIFYPTISVFNILHLNDILLEFKKYPDFLVNFDSVIHNPEYLAIHVLPESIKPIVEQAIQNIDLDNVNWWRKDDHKKILINFLHLSTSPYTTEEYVQILDNKLSIDDQRRKQDWRRSFPEIYNLLSSQ
jgi:MoaA/NifB/PqqE/SkfB family radical SAM enzyme